VGALVVEGTALEELRHQVARTRDGAGEQLGEEAQGGGVLDDAVRRHHVAAVDVDHVREVLEDVVADADGQEQVERHPIGVEAQGAR